MQLIVMKCSNYIYTGCEATSVSFSPPLYAHVTIVLLLFISTKIHGSGIVHLGLQHFLAIDLITQFFMFVPLRPLFQEAQTQD